jgi:TP901 family phage tail tape measure protein
MSKELKLAIEIKAVDLASQVLGKLKRNIEYLSQSNVKMKAQYEDLTKSLYKMGIAVGLTKELFEKVFMPGIEAASEYHNVLIDIQQVLGDTSTAEGLAKVNERMKQIKEIASDVQAMSPFKDEDILATEKALIKAGVAEKDLAEATKTVAQLGLAGHVNPTELAAGTARIAKQFKVSFTEIGNAVSKVSTTSNMSIESVNEAFRAAGPILSQYGVSVEDAGKLLQMTGKEGRKAGSEVATFTAKIAQSRYFIDPATGKLMAMGKVFKMLRHEAEILGPAALRVFTSKFGAQSGASILAAVKEDKWDKISKRYEESMTLEQRFTVGMNTLENQMSRLANVRKDILRQLFEPALPIVTELVKLTADLVGHISKVVEKSPGLRAAVSYGTMGALAVGGIAAAFFGLKALKAGGGLLKGAGGIGALLGGVAEGEALKRVAGVQPVYVVNAKEIGGGLGGLGGAAGGIGGLAGGAGMLKGLGGFLKNPWVIGPILAAGAGYGVGTLLNMALDKTGVGGKMSSGLAWMMSPEYRKNTSAYDKMNQKSTAVMRPSTMAWDSHDPRALMQGGGAPASTTSVHVYINDDEKKQKRVVQYNNMNRGNMLKPIYTFG